MNLSKKLTICAFASLCASAAWAADSTSFLGKTWDKDKTEVKYVDGGNNWCWSNGTPLGKTSANAMDVLFDGAVIEQAKAAKLKGFDNWHVTSISTWAWANASSSDYYNSITIKKGGITDDGIALGGQLNIEKDGKGNLQNPNADAYAGMTVLNDFTVDNLSTRITSGGVKANDTAPNGFTTIHSSVNIKGNFVYGYNNTETAPGEIYFTFGGIGGYRTAADGAAVGANLNALDSVVIEKDMRIASSYNIAFNVGTTAYGTDYDLSKPDVEIKGRLVGFGGTDSDGNKNNNGVKIWGKNQSYIKLMRVSSTDNADNGRTSVISVNGISGFFVISNDVAGRSTKNHLAVLKLTNDANTSVTTAYIADEEGVVFSDTSKVKIVMDGAGEQRFSEAFDISGGIEVNNGALLVKSAIEGVNGYNWAKKQKYSHGDLVMNGGIFGFYLADSLNKNFDDGFTLTNLVYNGGKIRLCAYSDYVDSLDVSGTITAADAIVFDFVAKGGDFSYLTSGARKIISWASAPSDTTYEANDITVGGTSYKAEFTELADGLYVQYTPSIPEPATCALLFGGLALAFAAWRKRK